MLLNKHIDHYLDYCISQKRLSEKTLKAYKIDLTQFTLFSSDATEPLSKDSISKYVKNLHQVYKPKTVKRKIASICAFLNYLEFEELIDSNPIHKIHLRNILSFLLLSEIIFRISKFL